LVLATGNAHKLEELGTILAAAIPAVDAGEAELVAMTELGVGAPVEDGLTFEANALIKARACVAATGLTALADDSGLEVDALGGAPGVYSARYAGEGATDAANNAKLVAALDGVPADARAARFVCAAALVTPAGHEVVRHGTMAGHIVDAGRGTAGFGYDPHLLVDGDEAGRTLAELSRAEKDTISHRGAAFRALADDVARHLAAR
jgi:XTP/dITP diphosphohydrolase